MRTITQRTTFPFLIAESGAASFTAAVTTSPSPARRPRSPPRGRMQERRRAPELSATSRIVLIPIIRNLLTVHVKCRHSPCFPSRFDIQFRRRHAHLGGPPHDAIEAPPL